MPRLKFPDQFYRVDGQNCFVEVTGFASAIDKVALNFLAYDASLPKGQREKNKICIYLDPFEAKVLAGDILSGKLAVLATQNRKKAKETGNKYPEKVYANLGGTPSNRTENLPAISRQFQVLPGAQKPWVLTAMSGPGKEMGSGLIAPDGPPTTTIRVPMDDQKLKEFAYAINMCVDIWGIAKFLPAIQPAVDAARERTKQQIADIAEMNNRDAPTDAFAGNDEDEGFPTEFPYAG